MRIVEMGSGFDDIDLAARVRDNDNGGEGSQRQADLSRCSPAKGESVTHVSELSVTLPSGRARNPLAKRRHCSQDQGQY